MGKHTKMISIMSISLPEDLKQQVGCIAYFEGISVSQFVRQALTKAITGGNENGNSKEGTADTRYQRDEVGQGQEAER